MARIRRDEAAAGSTTTTMAVTFFQNEAPGNRQTRRRGTGEGQGEGGGRLEAKRASNTSKRRLMRKSYGRHLRRHGRRQRRSERADLAASKLRSPPPSARSLGETGRPRRGKRRPPGGRLDCATGWCSGLGLERNISVLYRLINQRVP